MLVEHRPGRDLRSGSAGQLVIPRTKLKSVGDRAFSVYGPRIWNNSDSAIKNSVSVQAFKCRLKTVLFQQYFMQ